jgi:hypothetical protein
MVGPETALRDRLHSILGQHSLRWISLGIAKKKLRPGNQNYAKEAAY